MHLRVSLLHNFTNEPRSRRLEHDANDIVYALTQYWNQVDINRIPEQDMTDFVTHYADAGPAWAELKRKYRMYALSTILSAETNVALCYPGGSIRSGA